MIYILLFFFGVHGVLWVAELFVISRCLMACHSPDLFSGEGLVVRYKPYYDVPGCLVTPDFG